LFFLVSSHVLNYFVLSQLFNLQIFIPSFYVSNRCGRLFLDKVTSKLNKLELQNTY
jgi:hypothetical protein